MALSLTETPEVAVIARRANRVETFRLVERTAVKAAVFIALVAAVFTWVFGFAVVHGNGMKPAVGDGDLAITYKLDGQFAADDVVVYRADGKQLVGRVVALPGNTVEVTEAGQVKVNGNVQPSEASEQTAPAAGSVEYPLALGDGEYFILGDKRAQATDSREVGPVSTNDIEGKVIALLRFRGI